MTDFNMVVCFFCLVWPRWLSHGNPKRESDPTSTSTHIEVLPWHWPNFHHMKAWNREVVAEKVQVASASYYSVHGLHWSSSSRIPSLVTCEKDRNVCFDSWSFAGFGRSGIWVPRWGKWQKGQQEKMLHKCEAPQRIIISFPPLSTLRVPSEVTGMLWNCKRFNLQQQGGHRRVRAGLIQS